jgi:acyl-CoA reductase-like NAD-dependent aldehyde dehydrogenase
MIDIKKTYKNYVDGKYVRSESGKTYTKELKNEFYELPLTSRKDVRDTVTSSKSGFNKWNGLTPYTRMQILYRLSEMIDGNKESYIELLVSHGMSKQKANKDIELAIENIIWFAGLADKWEQLAGNLNPVSEEYFNISHQNPIGVVFSLSNSTVSLNELLLSLLPPLTIGCSVISYSEESSVLALKFAEDINNSDFPAGSLNILTGKFENILDDVSKHVEINLVALHKEFENDGLKRIQENASSSVKRVVSLPSISGLSSILPYLETKTVWHPKGT